jgi:hypothetical protein
MRLGCPRFSVNTAGVQADTRMTRQPMQHVRATPIAIGSTACQPHPASRPCAVPSSPRSGPGCLMAPRAPHAVRPDPDLVYCAILKRSGRCRGQCGIRARCQQTLRRSQGLGGAVAQENRPSGDRHCSCFCNSLGGTAQRYYPGARASRSVLWGGSMSVASQASDLTQRWHHAI